MDKFDLIKLLSESQDTLENVLQSVENAKLIRADLIQQCFDAGVTLEVISDVLGVSKQRVKQLLDAYQAKQFRTYYSKPEPS